MRNRRFLLLAATLVALNVSLWIVPQGLALQRVVVASLFGKTMIRADVTENGGAEWRIARGTVISKAPGVITLSEADSKVEDVPVSSATRIIVPAGSKPVKLSGIKPGWRILATWPYPSGTADSIVVEKRAKPPGASQSASSRR
jgi:hypothetical protein